MNMFCCVLCFYNLAICILSVQHVYSTSICFVHLYFHPKLPAVYVIVFLTELKSTFLAHFTSVVVAFVFEPVDCTIFHTLELFQSTIKFC